MVLPCITNYIVWFVIFPFGILVHIPTNNNYKNADISILQGQIRQQVFSSSPASVGNRFATDLEFCFDYLRQSIYCSADLAIEHTIETGMGVEHQCRDLKEVLAFIEKHNEDAARQSAMTKAT